MHDHKSSSKVALLFFPVLLENQNPLLVPLELISLAPGLQDLGLRIRIIDERLEPISSLDLEKELQEALFVGISVRPGGQVPRSFAFAKAVKAIKPDVPVVMGGWFPSIVVERVAAHPAVDYVITGEGERPIVEFCQALLDGRAPDSTPGVASMKGDCFCYMPHSKQSVIENSPIPAYHLLDIEKYLGPLRELSYISSKGCSGTCKFCAIHCGYDDKWHSRPAKTVIDELVSLVSKYNLKRIRFVDANFFTDEDRVIEIMEGFVHHNLRISWQAPGRIDQLLAYKNETWRLLEAGGCRQIEVGAESASPHIIKLMEKGIEPADVIRFADLAHSYNICGIFNYILGFPGETIEDMKCTSDAIFQMKAKYPGSVFAIYRFSPIPITELYAPLQGRPPGADDPSLVEEFKIYRLKPDQPWLDKEVSKTLDMLFYFYLPFALRPLNSAQHPIQALKNLMIRLARHRVREFNFFFPAEWWLLKFGTNLGIFNPQRFRQWAQS